MQLLRLQVLKYGNKVTPKWPLFSVATNQARNSLAMASLHQRDYSTPITPIKPYTLSSGIKLGAILNNFQVKSIEHVPDLYLTAIKLEHMGTGSDYLHIAREDPNNVFCVGFRTTPMDSTGVSHILEHTTLCGSEKYPCRDPFFKMLNRSLSTFMNAMTGPDYTIYPFASQNSKDFYNLMAVYLDAVLYPRLRELDFLQEGWRLEHQDPVDPETPLVFKGVVFNEMKGAFSDSQQILGQNLLNLLLPSHTYGHVSGGEPLKILDLTWDQLKNFHAKHYHPSNARFFTYGNFPLEKHLEFIDSYVTRFAQISPSEEVPLEPRWSSPKSGDIYCRTDPFAPDPTKQTTAVVSFALTDIRDSYDTFVAQILSELLLSGPSAPFYPTLLEPNIGMGLSPVSGFDAHTRDTTFSVGLQGFNDDDISKVFGIIEDTFRDVVATGFDSERIEGILHSVELNVRHQSANFGLNLAMGMTPLWNHNGDPVKALQIQAKVGQFRRDLASDPQFLTKLVQKYFIDNNHKLSLVMRPKEDYEEVEKSKEAKILSEKIAKLTTEDRKQIYEKGLKLKELQSTSEDVSCLPTLQISDIPAQLEKVVLQHQNINKIPLQLCLQPTNGITYFRSVLNTQHVPQNLKPFLPLFCAVLTKMGAGKLDYKQFDKRVELKTGGLGVGLHIRDDKSSLRKYEEGLVISSYALDRNLPEMFDLWSKIFHELDLSDEGRFETLVRHLVGDMLNGITHIGHQFAMSLAASVLTPAAEFREQLEGLTFVKQLRDLTEAGKFPVILENLRQISKYVLRPQNVRAALNMGPATSDEGTKALESFLQSVQVSVKSSDQPLNENSGFEASSCKIHHVLPVPINFTSRTYQTVPFQSSDFAPLRVLARIMSAKYLHPEIREKGGAYGGGANASASGIFSFYSYRDPRSLATLDSFSGAVDWALEANYEEESIKEAKLSIFQKIDAPTPPGSKGLTYFLNNITEEELNAHRDHIKQVTKEDLVRVTSTYLRSGQMTGNVILGPANADIANDKSWRIQ